MKSAKLDHYQNQMKIHQIRSKIINFGVINKVTAVDPYWLGELGPMFFSVKERGDDPEALRRQEA